MSEQQFRIPGRYLRLFKDKVEVDGARVGAPVRQLKAIKDYAASHDLRIVKVFEERGIAGARETTDRPGWHLRYCGVELN